MSLPKGKISLIHVARNRLDMDDAGYRALLQRAAGVSSSKDLDERGFEAVMAEFARLGFHSTKGRTQTSSRAGMASAAQVGKIRGLWEAYSGSSDDLRLGRWLERHFHVSNVRFLQDWNAGKAIAILIKMNDHARAKGTQGKTEPAPKSA